MADELGKPLTRTDLLPLMSSIVTAYVSRNAVAPGDIPALMRTVQGVLIDLLDGAGASGHAHGNGALKPAVPVEHSIEDEHIICLEDGLKFKSLRRHLRARYDMTPDQYRAKWSLPPDYPMVAPRYSRERSKLARKSGLGRHDKG